MRLLEYFWYRIRPVHLVLIPLSLLFAAIAGPRRTAYRLSWLKSERLHVPVIVVGNITVGGTGKTPMVLWLVELLRASGYHPGIIARGYGGSERLQEVHGDSDPQLTGDEPLLLARRANVPVFAGRERVAAARSLLQAHPECNVIVSDDGLQHYALARDVELAVVDSQRRFGNGWLLPAGPLREPVSRLRNVTAVVVNGDAELTDVPAPRYRMRVTGSLFRQVRDPQQQATAADLHGRPLHAIAAIGNPERFFSHLERMSLEFRRHPFPDHFAFAAGDLAFAGGETVLMTEKDAVKCAAFAKASWWYLPVEAEVDPALGQLILTKLRSLHGRQAA
jgi:tetraacyldisaccharide 4'-kinase